MLLLLPGNAAGRATVITAPPGRCTSPPLATAALC
jgi:hypothetical protein